MQTCDVLDSFRTRKYARITYGSRDFFKRECVVCWRVRRKFWYIYAISRTGTAFKVERKYLAEALACGEGVAAAYKIVSGVSILISNHQASQCPYHSHPRCFQPIFLYHGLTFQLCNIERMEAYICWEVDRGRRNLEFPGLERLLHEIRAD